MSEPQARVPIHSIREVILELTQAILYFGEREEREEIPVAVVVQYIADSLAEGHGINMDILSADQNLYWKALKLIEEHHESIGRRERKHQYMKKKGFRYEYSMSLLGIALSLNKEEGFEYVLEHHRKMLDAYKNHIESCHLH